MSLFLQGFYPRTTNYCTYGVRTVLYSSNRTPVSAGERDQIRTTQKLASCANIHFVRLSVSDIVATVPYLLVTLRLARGKKKLPKHCTDSGTYSTRYNLHTLCTHVMEKIQKTKNKCQTCMMPAS